MTVDRIGTEPTTRMDQNYIFLIGNIENLFSPMLRSNVPKLDEFWHGSAWVASVCRTNICVRPRLRGDGRDLWDLFLAARPPGQPRQGPGPPPSRPGTGPRP